MNDRTDKVPAVSLIVDPEYPDQENAERLKEIFHSDVPRSTDADPDWALKLDADGLAFHSGGQVLKGDYTHMLPRLKTGNLSKELLVKAAKIKGPTVPLFAIDATAGLGEDSLLLAAAGFHVKLYERNPIIYELLSDTVKRAGKMPELEDIVGRMELFRDDSVRAMKVLDTPPDVILLDPMFPERQKSALVKKKLQVIQKLESPCINEEELIMAAMNAKPKKLIIKRPPKGPYLAGIKPDYSLSGKAVRFDCFVSPYDRIGKFKRSEVSTR